ncbi:MAG: DUF2079 domain-containing protein, partial [Myxococcota bacterium]
MRAAPQQRIPLATGFSAVLGAVAAVVLGVLLHRSLFQAYAQSYDTMIYSQTLWGLGHGELFNTVAERLGMAVHANLVLGLLAPLTWVLPACLVLILAQAVAWGATVGCITQAFAHEAARQGQSPASSCAVGAGAALLASVGSAMLMNPWLFDARPDMVGVPLLTVGLLRALERGEFDRVAVGWMLASLLGREEFALVVAAGLVFAPVPRQASATGGLSLRSRFLIALGCGLYYVLYVGLIAIGLGDTGAVIQLMLDGSTPSAETAEHALADFAYHKGILIALTVTSMGGLSLVGWRWLGSCLPGLGLLLINRHVLEHQVLFHYSALLIPGLLTAAVAAYRDWPQNGWRAHPLVRYGPWIVLGGVHFVTSSAAPGGGRFVSSAFDMKGPDGGLRRDLAQHSPQLLELHTMIQAIPDADGLAVPYPFGAPVAGRTWVKPVLNVLKEVHNTQTVPKALDTVVLHMRPPFLALGRRLVGREGFMFLDHQRGYALLSRSPRLAPTHKVDWRRILQEGTPGSCKAPLGYWPAVGLALCEVRQLTDGRWSATLMRRQAPQNPKALTLFMQPKPDGSIIPMGLMGGVVPPHQL